MHIHVCKFYLNKQNFEDENINNSIKKKLELIVGNVPVSHQFEKYAPEQVLTYHLSF